MAGSVMAVGSAQLLNGTGITADDLRLLLSSQILELNQNPAVFSTVNPQDASSTQWDLTGGSVPNATSIGLSWSATVPWSIPQLRSFAWVRTGHQVGSLFYPLYLDLDVSSLPRVTLTLVNPRDEFVDYDQLTITAGGGAPIVKNGSGRLSPFGQLGDRLSFLFDASGGFQYAVDDVSSGVSLQGMILAPEPVSSGLVGAGLVLCAWARRRARTRRAAKISVTMQIEGVLEGR